MSMELMLQLLQTASVVLAMAVAAGTIRGRSNDRTVTLTKMQVDIEYIKEHLDIVDKHTARISELEACCKTLSKRLDDHLWFEHGRNKESDKE